jgi:hypothetical protein
MDSIVKNFPITQEEYANLDKAFGDLCEYAAWQLIKKNSRNNHTDDQCDIAQELRFSLINAGSYFKRQVYIEKCLDLCFKYVEDKFLKNMVEELIFLWNNKTRHGANRQKFGPYQEQLLDRLTKFLVPREERPSKREPLSISPEFKTYCKAITWNRQKSIGKKYTREKCIRTGMVSLSEYDYLVTC